MNNKHFFGLQPSPAAVRDYDFFACCGSAASTDADSLPDRFVLPIDDWAHVRNQYDVNACVGYALSSAQEAHHCKTTGERVLWSPGYIYGNKECRPNYLGEGMYLRSALNGVTKVGFVRESLFNIVKEMPEMKNIMDSRQDLLPIGKERKLEGFVSLNYADSAKKIESMKKALYTYRVPLVVSSYRYFGGGHCILVYGWDNDISIKRYAKNDTTFLLRNSWGEEYGEGGNSHIPVSELDEVFLPIFEDFDFPFIDVSPEDWYYNEVLKATFSGLFQGISKTQFEPKADVIRGDIAVTIERLLKKFQTSINAFIKTLDQKGIEAYPVYLQEPDKEIYFDDIAKEDYYYDAVRFACANTIMNGAEEHKFAPSRAIDRAEMSAVVVRTYLYVMNLINTAVPSANLKMANKGAKKFSDVLASEWYYSYVEKATQIGLIQGDDDGNYRPHDNIIRAEAATLLNRLFKSADDMLVQIIS